MERKGKKGSWSVFMGFVLTAAVALTGCGGGGGGGGGTSGETATSLRVAEKISVVDASSTSSGAAPLRVGRFRLAPPSATADSAWNTDTTQVYVAERSTEAFDTVNEILCMMSQSKYDAMLNKGNYRAQIDMNQCSSDNDSASNAGQSSQNQSSGSTMPNYEWWTVNSSRTDNSSPQYVKVWIHEEAQEFEPAKIIYAYTTITESASSTNPYGLFTVNFKAHPVDPATGNVNTSITMFRGYLKAEKDATTGKVLLKFAQNGGFSGGGNKNVFNQYVVLDRAASATGSSGSGTMKVFDSYSSSMGKETKDTKFDIAFTPDYFRRADAPDNTNNEVCLSRKTFDETAWRYGLYDANGARVNRNSGFPIKATVGGVDYQGWVGYWGMGFPDDISSQIKTNVTVYKQTYGPGGGTSTPYTVVKVGGKLKRHTQKLMTLADIKNIPLDYWDNQTSTNYRVIWKDSVFNKVAQLNQSTYMWTDITPVALDLSSLNFGDLNFWSQALNGQVRVKLTCTGTYPLSCSATDSNDVVFYSEDIIYPGDTTIPASLSCYDNCPDPANLTGTNPFFPVSYDPSTATSYSYAFDSTNALLKYGSSDIVLSDANAAFQWGIMSGPLFEANPTNLALLACDFTIPDPNNPGQYITPTCGWKAWSELPVFYTWETGPEQWNQLTVLKDSTGAVLTFDPPLQVAYTHSQSDTSALDYKYNGSKFYLEYAGFGDLHGIPGTCVDWNTGDPVSCGQNTRWIPEFMIPEGAIVTNGNGTYYYVKPLEKEQRMKQAAASNCSTLTFGTTLDDLPVLDSTTWTDPETAIGAEPAVTGAPAVIGGVLQ